MKQLKIPRPRRLQKTLGSRATTRTEPMNNLVGSHRQAGVAGDASRRGALRRFKLTPEIGGLGVRSYCAMDEIVSEGHMDLWGIKGTPELTNNFTAAHIAEAILNDPGGHGPTLPVTQEVVFAAGRRYGSGRPPARSP